MKLAVAAILLLIGVGIAAWITYPWEYSEADTEALFQKIAKDGFDRDTASKLLKQYRVSDASFRTHFLAFGHLAQMKNRAAFNESLNQRWSILVKDITDHGEACAEDWFNPEKYQEIKKAINSK